MTCPCSETEGVHHPHAALFEGPASLVERAQAWTLWGRARVPARFAAPAEETMALRQGAGLTDLTGLRRFHVGGPDAAAFVERLIARPVADLEPGQILMGLMAGRGGRLVALARLVRLGPNDFMLGTDGTPDLWLDEASRPFTVSLADLSEPYAALGLYGPRAREVLEACGLSIGMTLAPLRTGALRHAGSLVTLLHMGDWCLGYGLPGAFELWVPRAAAATLWERLSAGLPEGVTPLGRASLETERVLMGRPRLGAEVPGLGEAPIPARVPTAADLGWQHWTAAPRPTRRAPPVARLLRLDCAAPVARGARVLRDGVAVTHLGAVATCPLSGETRALAMLAEPPTPGGVWSIESRDPARPDPVSAHIAPQAHTLSTDRPRETADRPLPVLPLKARRAPGEGRVRLMQDNEVVSDGLGPAMRKSL